MTSRPLSSQTSLAASGEADIEAARRVLRLAREGIDSLAESLGTQFVKALDLLDAAKGRIIVSGMGKSGHIGRKIAATLASTGRPAFFVHPAEASHGDLGMVTDQDAILAISNSGETPELSDLVGYAKRFTIPLVAITSKAESSLAQAADAALLLPRLSEACPMGLAPTTSTTLTLALGDALAVALLERKGFTAADFQLLHPGGQLGRRLLKVSDIMHTGDGVPLAGPEMAMADILLIMSAKSFGCVGITGPDGRLMGIVTDGDLRRHMSPALLGEKAGTVMTTGPKTVRPQTLAAEALRLMNTCKITSLFVIDDEKPVGILHVHDCLRAGVA